MALNCALLFFVFKFKDIVDVVDGIFQGFSLPTFYKVHCTRQNLSSFSGICFYLETYREISKVFICELLLFQAIGKLFDRYLVHEEENLGEVQ